MENSGQIPKIQFNDIVRNWMMNARLQLLLTAWSVLVLAWACTPCDAAGLPITASPRVWFETENGEGTAYDSTGGFVDTWKDQSGNGNHLTSSTTHRPSLAKNLSAVNGHTGLSFDGVDDWMRGEKSLFVNTAQATVFLVAQVPPLDGHIRTFLDSGPDGSTRRWSLWALGDPKQLRFNRDGLGGAIEGGHGRAAGEYVLLTGVADGTASHVAVNGAVIGSGPVNTELNTSGTPWTIGERFAMDQSASYQGNFVELIIYDTALSDGDRNKIGSYIARKYGLTISSFAREQDGGKEQDTQQQEVKKGDEKPVFDIETLFDVEQYPKDLRLPKMVIANDGTLIAFAGACRIYRRSEDKGETWFDVQRISPECGGANVVVDRITGDILVLDQSKRGFWRSKDTAKTWKFEKAEFRANRDGQGIFGKTPFGTAGSEAGITLMHGKYKGRLIIPARFRPMSKPGDDGPEYMPYTYNSVIYSDDRGKTWQAGEPVQSGTAEAAVAELSDGSVYINSRAGMYCDNRRRIAWSYDGGANFGDWSASDELFEPGGPTPTYKHSKKGSYGTSGGLARMPDGTTEYEDVLLFSMADSKDRRRGMITTKLVVMASFDREETWPVERHVPHEGGPCYSSITADKDGMIYVLFEGSHYGNRGIHYVTFAKFNLAWLKEGDPPDWNGDPPAGN